jgi:predicted dehydrogenase
MTDTRYRRASADQWEAIDVGLLDFGLTIIGCHEIDQARFLIGEIEAVSTATSSPRDHPKSDVRGATGRTGRHGDDCRPVIEAYENVLQPYCNRAGTHWYTMDKAIPPDHRKPPK